MVHGSMNLAPLFPNRVLLWEWTQLLPGIGVPGHAGRAGQGLRGCLQAEGMWMCRHEHAYAKHAMTPPDMSTAVPAPSPQSSRFERRISLASSCTGTMQIQDVMPRTYLAVSGQQRQNGQHSCECCSTQVHKHSEQPGDSVPGAGTARGSRSRI